MRPTSVRHIAWSVLCVVCASAPSASAPKAPSHNAPAQAASAEPATLEEWGGTQLDSALVEYKEDGDLGKLAGRSGAVLETLIAWSPEPAGSAALVRAFVIEQHASGLSGIGDPGAREIEGLAEWLLGLEKKIAGRRRQQPGGWVVAEAISALRRPEVDLAEGVYKVLGELRSERGEHLDLFPELVAALAVVFDAGLPPSPIEQEVAHPVDAVAVFDHLAGRAGAFRMNPQRMPGNLLVHVVDAPVSESDLVWGLQRCRNNVQVGEQFHQVNYDTQAILDGNKALRLDTENASSDFGLPAVLRSGGVCRHQAFFAASVGKSIAVPTVYIRADGPNMGHAWVGYLRTGSRGAYWDMEEGRWDDYQKLRGEIRCPQTGRTISDQQVGMTAELWGVPLQNRLAAAAMAAAAIRLEGLEGNAAEFPPAKPAALTAKDPEQDGEQNADGDSPRRPAPRSRRRSARSAKPSVLESPRPANPETRFGLLRDSVSISPWSRYGWDLLKSWSEDLSNDERQAWFEAANRLVGKRFPDVMVTTAMPMIETMDDPAARDAAWLWLGRSVQRTPQLALEVAVERAAGMADAGEMDAAWNAYALAAKSYAAEGPFVLDALRGAERLLRNAPNQAAADAYLLDLHAEVFKRLPMPSMTVAPEYRQGSTYVRVGQRYTRYLDRAGRTRDAANIRQLMRQGQDP